ncbi:MAG: TonB-dependent receptor [Bacteroidota bacterium]|nr:TonB-dependent receptor [Bacteroidota bacterium]
MEKIRRLGHFPFGNGSQILLKIKLLSVGLLFGFASVAADGFSLNSNPEQVINPVEQQKQVSGTVNDSQGVPIPGATVIVTGTNIGTITDIDGKFRFSVPATARTLTISFVGMTSKEVTIGTNTNFTVVLADSNVGLEEVVVVGYGTQRKESVVGAISQVDNKTLMRSGTSNITNAIAGKLSGVLTIQQTGEPGNNDAEIIIRGLSSWNGSQPLVLVDGVERDFTDLDPNEINTLSVLKDASATAVFGAKGANGVILVTTKSGSLGKPKLDFSASYGVQKATRIPDHIDSYTTMSLLNVARMNGGQYTDLLPESILEEYRNPSTPLNALRYPNVNWFDLLAKPYAPTVNANFNVTGGTKFIKYFCSLGFMNESGFFEAKKDGFYDMNYHYNRFNYRANVDFDLTPDTKLSFKMGGETGIKNQPNSSPWRNLYATSPARFPAYFPEWVLEQVPDTDYPDARGMRLSEAFGEYTGNPYTSLNTGEFRQYVDSKLFTDLILDQKLDFITEGLSFNSKVSLSTYFRNNSLLANWAFPQYKLDYTKIGAVDPISGKPLNPWTRSGQANEVYTQPPLDINVGNLQDDYYRDLYYEFALNYSRTFGNHSITGLALLNRQQKNKGTDFAYFNQALVGRTTYDYKHKYLLEFNVGYTGSERFAPGNRFGLFPAGAIGWVISEEPFFKAAFPVISKLKLRYSDGKVGSDYARSRWLYQSDYFKDSRGHIHEDLGANLVAQWEEARKRDIGLELGLFKDQFTLVVDLFDEQRDQMLLVPRSATMLIGNSFKELNLGEVKKHGIEVEIGFNKTVNKNFNYFLKAIMGYNENRVLFKDDPPYAPDHTKLAGKPLTEMLSNEFGLEGLELSGVELTGTGYYTSVDDIHNNPSPIALEKLNVGDYKFLDYLVDGTITALDKHPIKGLTYPPFTFSWSSGFTYRNFDFHFMFQGNLGKYVQYNQTYEVEFIKGDWRVHSSQLDYWAPNNPTAKHSTLHYSGSSSADILFWGGGEADRGYQVMIEDRFFRNADYMRLKEVYAGYTFDPGYLNKLAGVSSFLVYVTGNNLWTLTNLIEGDPERKDFQQGFYPQMSSFKVGVKFVF